MSKGKKMIMKEEGDVKKIKSSKKTKDDHFNKNDSLKSALFNLNQALFIFMDLTSLDEHDEKIQALEAATYGLMRLAEELTGIK